MQGQTSRPCSLSIVIFMIHRSKHLFHHLPILFRHSIPEGPITGTHWACSHFLCLPNINVKLDFLPASLPTLPSPAVSLFMLLWPLLLLWALPYDSCCLCFPCTLWHSVWSRNIDQQTPETSPRCFLRWALLATYPKNKRFVWTIEWVFENEYLFCAYHYEAISGRYIIVLNWRPAHSRGAETEPKEVSQIYITRARLGT